MKKTLYTHAYFRFLKRRQARTKLEEERKKSYESRHLHALKRVRGKRGTEKKETKSKFLGPSIVSGQIFLGDKMGGGVIMNNIHPSVSVLCSKSACFSYFLREAAKKLYFFSGPLRGILIRASKKVLLS